MKHPARVRTAPARFLTLALTLGTLAGCSEDDPAPDRVDDTVAAPALTVAADPVPAAVPTKVRVGPVVGRLPRKRRRALVRRVTPLVDRWIDDKWVGGDWPRDIAGDFPGFTRGATRAARRDLRVTTAADLAGRVDGVEVTRRAVRLEVLAVDRRPIGVTARVALDFRTDGKARRKVSVRGRLLLTRVRGSWKVFGYDLTQGKR